MIQNLVNVGPPLQGPPSWSSSTPGRNEESKESFEKALADGMSTKNEAHPKEVDAPVRSDQGQDDQIEAKVEEPHKGQQPDPLEKKAALLRQKAIKEFMDSFESEFSIPPTRLVEAMAQLPVEQLETNPELTADSVLAQLDLSEDEKLKAKDMYLGLLVELRQIDKSAAPPVLVVTDPQLTTGSQMKERFALAQEKKSLLNQSLDRMNQNFWMTPTEAPLQGSGAEAVAAQKLDTIPTTPWEQQQWTQEASWESRNQPFPTEQLGPSLEQPQQEFPQNPGPAELGKNMDSGKGKEILKELQKVARHPQEGKPDPQAIPPVLNRGQVEVPLEMKANSTPLTAAALQGFMPEGMPQGMPQQGSGQQGFQNQQNQEAPDTKSIKNLGADLKGSEFMVSNPSAVGSEVTLTEPTPVAIAGAPAAEMSDEGGSDASIRQVMNQAQYLIKKGGGEVNVKMSPEGLGQVHMKVVVNEGKVNVQMAAESREAKDIIEKSLSELKVGLAAQKLSVDHVKVDVVNSASTDNSTQSQFDQQQSQKEGTREFWNQFQQNFGNRSQRDGFYSMSNLKGYNDKKAQPIPAIEGESKGRRTSEAKGRGLDLVA